MKEYFAVWEVYSSDWALVEKGYHFFLVREDENLMILVDDFCDASAEGRGISTEFFTVTSIQPV